MCIRDRSRAVHSSASSHVPHLSVPSAYRNSAGNTTNSPSAERNPGHWAENSDTALAKRKQTKYILSNKVLSEQRLFKNIT